MLCYRHNWHGGNTSFPDKIKLQGFTYGTGNFQNNLSAGSDYFTGNIKIASAECCCIPHRRHYIRTHVLFKCFKEKKRNSHKVVKSGVR